MIAALTNHLWQSSLFAVAAGLVAWTLRRNGAHVRHAIWLTASVKFLIPFSWLMSIGGWLPNAPVAMMAPQAITAPGRPDIAVVVDQIAQPFTSVFTLSALDARPVDGSSWIVIAVLVIWICGALVIAASWFRAWRRVRTALRTSIAVDLTREIAVRASPGLLEPGVVGLWRPVLLVPEGLERHLTRQQLDAVLAHELCHVRRRDNLTAAIHMVVESVFWFHPVVWWIGARLVAERERACDEHVLRVCGEPQIYAESILSVCKLYVESPLACVSGVTGADLKRRVAAIMINHVGVQLTTVRKAVLAIVVVLALALPLAAGVVTAPLHAVPQNAAANFDVVSIKLCDPKAPLPVRDPASPAGTRSGIAPWAARTSPGYVLWACVTLPKLIEQAYADADHPLLNTITPPPHSTQPPHVRGGPDWVETDTFTIEATAPVEVTTPALAGTAFRGLSSLPPAMSRALQVMLEDRFRLKVHRATEQADVYVMTVAKTGINKTTMRTPVPGDCQTIAQYSAAAAQNPSAPFANPKICGRVLSTMEGAEFSSVTMPTLANYLASLLDRFVLNRTGVDGTFNFELQTRDGIVRQTGSGAPSTIDERLRQGVQGLGLRIDLEKLPVEYFAIDRVERPRPNAPVEIIEPPARAMGAGHPR